MICEKFVNRLGFDRPGPCSTEGNKSSVSSWLNSKWSGNVSDLTILRSSSKPLVKPHTSIEPHAVSPAVSARVDDNPIGKRVGIASGDRWDMVFIPIDNAQYF